MLRFAINIAIIIIINSVDFFRRIWNEKRKIRNKSFDESACWLCQLFRNWNVHLTPRRNITDTNEIRVKESENVLFSCGCVMYEYAQWCSHRVNCIIYVVYHRGYFEKSLVLYGRILSSSAVYKKINNDWYILRQKRFLINFYRKIFSMCHPLQFYVTVFLNHSFSKFNNWRYEIKLEEINSFVQLLWRLSNIRFHAKSQIHRRFQNQKNTLYNRIADGVQHGSVYLRFFDQWPVLGF